jgi:alpha-L-rhamnosidase
MVMIFLTLAWTSVVFGQGQPHSLTVGEGAVNPLGFHDATPTFSWLLPNGVKSQSAYQIEVTDLGSENKTVWDSGWVESDQSVFVPYGGSELRSRQRLKWRVRYKDAQGSESDWSEPAKFELGLLSKAEWTAKWIRPAATAPDKVEKVAGLRQEFEVNRPIKHARLYVTSRGLFEIKLNGKKVGKDHFANGQTSYSNRIDSVSYNVTDQLQQGSNKINALLGYGWYAGRFGWKGQRHVFGKYPELLVQLEVTYQDGQQATFVSDDSWQGTIVGPIVSSSIYDGEHFDARKDWTNWQPVIADADLGTARITPKPFAPVRVTEVLPVQDVTSPKPGSFIFDLRQNMVGWAKLNIPVEQGQTITVRFAEMLNADGTVHTDNYRAAKSTDSYTAASTGTIQWQPKFTFHGFRFVELSGFQADVKPSKDWVTGVVLHSDLNKIGSFESSHSKLNQLQSNISWGQRGNFLDIPTDCPQRDERAGWTGDAQAFTPTSMFNYDCRAFWKSWLESMRDDQLENGNIPHVIPDIVGNGGSPGWVDAATFVPWEVYLRSGDTEVLSDNFEMMEKLVGWYRGRTKNGLMKIKGFGDWLQPHSKKTRGDTPHPLLGMAFYGRSCQILADSARVLGKKDKAAKYSAEAKSVKQAFMKQYFDVDGKIQNAPETQTAYLLAIAFNLIPESMKEPATVNLVRLIDEADGHLRTGFLGTPYVVSVLDQMGRTELAYSLLFKETYPSWFYSINQGASTMWERWNSYSKKDGFSGDNMNSLNHYAYGAIGQWMYERVAGLTPDPTQPGYKHFFVRPLISDQLDWAKAELQTAYGKASSGWKKENGKIVMNVVVPPNTTATIEFPGDRKSETVAAGSYRFELE